MSSKIDFRNDKIRLSSMLITETIINAMMFSIMIYKLIWVRSTETYEFFVIVNIVTLNATTFRELKLSMMFCDFEKFFEFDSTSFLLNNIFLKNELFDCQTHLIFAWRDFAIEFIVSWMMKQYLSSLIKR